MPFDGPILVITGPTFTKLVDDASCDTDDLTSLDAICLTFTCWRGLMLRDQVSVVAGHRLLGTCKH